jgi:hypothetical protein
MPAVLRHSVLLFFFALFVAACGSDAQQSEAGETEKTASVPPLVDSIEARTFRWFWDFTNAERGLVAGRAPSQPFSSVAAIGFGLTVYPVGVKRGYVTRVQARNRTLTTLEFLWNAPQGPEARGKTGHRGFFYHFLDMETGHRFKEGELSSIDTALLMGGVLFAQSYFDGEEATESRIRALADSLYRRVEWDWMQPRDPLVGMAWRPGEGFSDYDYEGYNEAMILYLLALGSPTHPIDEAAWAEYTSTYTWDTFQGYEHVNFSPLFGHQYSHTWVDFRNIQDAYMREKGIDYFENSRRAVLAQQAYAEENPKGWNGYGEHVWGLTASSGPATVKKTIDGRTRQFRSYWGRGASAEHVRDDGTLSPAATAGSLPFAPEIIVPTLQTMHERYGEWIWGPYGFFDAFNPTFTFTDAESWRGTVDPKWGWRSTDYLSTNQGPIVLMVENHRSGFVWDVMKQNKYVVRGLCRAGFSGDWLDGRCKESAP